MTPIVAGMLLAGMCVADNKPTPPPPKLTPLSPETHWRLAKLAGAQPQKIGILTYYPNEGGGYTFFEHGEIVFYALPLLPTTYQIDRSVLVLETRNGKVAPRRIGEQIRVFTVGKSAMPFGGQTIYRTGTTEKLPGDRRREDVPIAKWSRDSPGEEFRLSILDDDRETRLKLKSIVPVLRNASKDLSTRP